MANILGYNMPDELYYHKEHSWARVNEDGTVTVGMNEFYYKLAGETTYIDLPMEDDEVSQGETCGKLQSSKWVGKFVSPLSGVIIAVNEKLEDDCTILNQDPYGEGWIMKLKPSNLEEELKNLYHGETVEPWLKQEIEDAEKKKQG
ncbi:glycine cleavage system protein H [candidate division WOR-3 bacterium]|uniref:Glycine cleavage system protein H n=1 Tax=candidate division WOR-3 bacterium TaxID=2052148 RepID=A0A660SKQ2_UNCW3|nr:MAG: glycine cleavage system protein H [candidate division WOR-3 bacterium]